MKKVLIFQCILYCLMVLGGMYLAFDSFCQFGSTSSITELVKGIIFAFLSIFFLWRIGTNISRCDRTCDNQRGE